MVIGLTGGIACGKSVAAQMFEDAGAYIIDTDVISREVSGGSEAKSALMREFGEAFKNGVLDRGALRKTVFENKEKLQKLNGIMHPLIKRQTERRIAEIIEAHPRGLVVVVAPLLFEAEFDKSVEKSVTVSCETSTRIERLIKRDNISYELALKMINSQLSDTEREQRADITITNNGSLAELRAQVGRIYCDLS